MQWLRTFLVRYVELNFIRSARMSHSPRAMTTSDAATRSTSVDEALIAEGIGIRGGHHQARERHPE